ncbi:hypothetical protein [Methylobacterium sp. Leaf469]|uniref:hypothetical protein n=1 Tax=Methylobacterium sp. Leaf469 TaxID=1736387 RepID=UPI0012E3F02F|nr:hypothetical protein [Methylobacterium sp. Leaf469]
MTLSLDVVSDICDQVAAWEAAFLSETSLNRFRRASACAMSETSKAAKIGATDALDDAFQNPTPWMRRAFTYKRALSRTGDSEGAHRLRARPRRRAYLRLAG